MENDKIIEQMKEAIENLELRVKILESQQNVYVTKRDLASEIQKQVRKSNYTK
jgi:chaperonin cofactor prefoldin